MRAFVLWGVAREGAGGKAATEGTEDGGAREGGGRSSDLPCGERLW